MKFFCACEYLYAFLLGIFLGMKCLGVMLFIYSVSYQQLLPNRFPKTVEPFHIPTSNVRVLTFNSNARTWPTLQTLAPISLISALLGALMDDCRVSVVFLSSYIPASWAVLCSLSKNPAFLPLIYVGKMESVTPWGTILLAKLNTTVLIMSFSCTPPTLPPFLHAASVL